jgi:hypothetical protein
MQYIRIYLRTFSSMKLNVHPLLTIFFSTFITDTTAMAGHTGYAKGRCSCIPDWYWSELKEIFSLAWSMVSIKNEEAQSSCMAFERDESECKDCTVRRQGNEASNLSNRVLYVISGVKNREPSPVVMVVSKIAAVFNPRCSWRGKSPWNE